MNVNNEKYSSKENEDEYTENEDEEYIEEEEEEDDDNNNDKITNNNKNKSSTKISITVNPTEKDKIILQLKKELQDKENKIKKITKLNNKLRQSLDKFSKKIDNKIFDDKNNKNIFENKNKRKSIKYKNDKITEKELNNAISMIKILTNDNARLQSIVDSYENDNKINDLEFINKQKMDENNNLENENKILKNQLNDFDNYIKKCKEYEKQIESLNKENKTLKNNIKLLNNEINNKAKKNDKTISSNRDNNINNNDNNNYIFQNFLSQKKRKISFMKLEKKIGDSNTSKYNKYKITINPIFKSKRTNLYLNQNNLTLSQKGGSLPLINKAKTPVKSNSLSKIISFKKNYDNIENILSLFFTQEEIDTINKLFTGNNEGLEAFKLKLCIINKSKESLNNKFNKEIKKYKERLISSQEQINYLNNKIKELEVNCQVLQTQKNEEVIRKRLLIKKIKNLEKNLIEKENILKLNFCDEANFDNNKVNESQNNENINYNMSEDMEENNENYENNNNDDYISENSQNNQTQQNNSFYEEDKK